jgi:MFS family permease
VQWRLPLALAVVPALVMGAGMFDSIVSKCASAYTGPGVWFIPESPRWLIWNSRSDQAWTILQRMHHDPVTNSDAAARAEFVQIEKQVAFDKQFDVSYIQMFRKPAWRKRTLLGMFVFFANQSTGVLGIGNFAILIYQSLGMTGSMPILMNAIYTTSATVFADVAACFIMDRVGRRKLMRKFFW